MNFYRHNCCKIQFVNKIAVKKMARVKVAKLLALIVLYVYLHVELIKHIVLIALKLLTDSDSTWTEAMLLTLELCLVMVSLVSDYYLILLYDSGMILGRPQYGVALGGVIEATIDDIVEHMTREDIHELMGRMYQGGFLITSQVEEIQFIEAGLCNRELMNIIVSLANRGESIRRILRGMQHSLEDMATDRNNCAEIAEMIDQRLSRG